MPALRPLATALLPALLACACGSPGVALPTAPSDAGAYFPKPDARPPYDYRGSLTSDPAVLDACARYADAELAYESTCTIAIHPDKRAYYVDRYELACRVAASEPRAGFAPAVIDACSQALATWQAARCEHRPILASLRDPLDVCKSFLAGTAGPGDPCRTDAECSSGLCAAPTSFLLTSGSYVQLKTYTGCGTCARVVGVGETCDLTTPPDPSHVDAFCGPGTGCLCGGSDCLASTCVAGGAEGGDCSKDYACATGLECRYMSIPQALLCVAPKPVGAACAEQNECADDDVCHAGTCAPQALAGEACRLDGATVPFDTGCIGSLECIASLACEPPAFGALQGPGAPCGRSLVQVDDCRYGASLCLASDDLVCPGPFQPEGAACTRATDCDGTSLCVDGRCQPLTTAACEAHASVN